MITTQFGEYTGIGPLNWPSEFSVIGSGILQANTRADTYYGSISGSFVRPLKLKLYVHVQRQAANATTALLVEHSADHFR